MSTVSLPDILDAITRAASDAASPEDRRAAVVDVLHELSPMVEDALEDRPVALAAWALVIQGAEVAEGGLTVDEAGELARDFVALVGMLVTAPLARVRRRPMSPKEAMAKAKALALTARSRAQELSAGDLG